jgi:hypothetical protein
VRRKAQLLQNQLLPQQQNLRQDLEQGRLTTIQVEQLQDSQALTVAPLTVVAAVPEVPNLPLEVLLPPEAPLPTVQLVVALLTALPVQ